MLYDADQQNYPYLKRFTFEATTKKQNFLGDNKHTQLILLTCQVYPRIQVDFGVKSFKAKGKRLTTYTVGQITELEPTRMPESEPEEPEKEEDGMEEDESQEDDGQMKLF